VVAVSWVVAHDVTNATPMTATIAERRDFFIGVVFRLAAGTLLLTSTSTARGRVVAPNVVRRQFRPSAASLAGARCASTPLEARRSD
jgi:hypothetical protein